MKIYNNKIFVIILAVIVISAIFSNYVQASSISGVLSDADSFLSARREPRK